MQIHLHQTHQQVAQFSAIFQCLMEKLESHPSPGLHLFPEMFLCGYPTQDLCQSASFIHRYHLLLDKINRWSTTHWRPQNDTEVILGGLHYDLDQNNRPQSIFNVLFRLKPGEPLHCLYKKKLLPNYDIFDEKKYFSPGNEVGIYRFCDKVFGTLVCEDMWASKAHESDPCLELHQFCQRENITLDAVICPSASPFHLHKKELRVQRAQFLAEMFNCPFIYVNRVGGEDEIIFEGHSFVATNEGLVHQAASFGPDSISFDLEEIKRPSLKKEERPMPAGDSFDTLFEAALDTGTPPKLLSWSDEDCQLATTALQFGAQEYAGKCGMDKFLVAVSGGLDSALVLALLKLGLREGQEIEAIYMPGAYSSSLSTQLAQQLCDNLSVKLHFFPIKFLHKALGHAFLEHMGTPLDGLSDENAQSRLRGSILYCRSNQTGAMVANTSNKSEIAVGYSTLYGDSVGALSIIGDLYKSEVTQLANYLNKTHDNIIPAQIIERPPTAELREDQKDADSLPPYAILDALLEGILSYRFTRDELIKKKFMACDVDKVFDLYTRSEYKRSQFCPIIKIKTKSFGFGYRVPITKDRAFYRD